jgi:hypothetical protein
MSKSDIYAGDRWQEALGKELEACNFGILCITRQNLQSPWLTFEAGSLAKARSGSRVIPLLLDVDEGDITGPLSQFQAKRADKPGIEGMIQSINNGSEPPVPEAKIKELFELLWTELEAKLQAIPSDIGDAPPKRQSEEILEELVLSVRSLEARVRGLSERAETVPSYYAAGVSAFPRGARISSKGVTVGGQNYLDGTIDDLSLVERFVLKGVGAARPVKEIADELGITVGQVGQIYIRARTRLGTLDEDDSLVGREDVDEEEK